MKKKSHYCIIFIMLWLTTGIQAQVKPVLTLDTNQTKILLSETDSAFKSLYLNLSDQGFKPLLQIGYSSKWLNNLRIVIKDGRFSLNTGISLARKFTGLPLQSTKNNLFYHKNIYCSIKQASMVCSNRQIALEYDKVDLQSIEPGFNARTMIEYLEQRFRLEGQPVSQKIPEHQLKIELKNKQNLISLNISTERLRSSALYSSIVNLKTIPVNRKVFLPKSTFLTVYSGLGSQMWRQLAIENNIAITWPSFFQNSDQMVFSKNYKGSILVYRVMNIEQEKNKKYLTGKAARFFKKYHESNFQIFELSINNTNKAFYSIFKNNDLYIISGEELKNELINHSTGFEIRPVTFHLRAALVSKLFTHPDDQFFFKALQKKFNEIEVIFDSKTHFFTINIYKK